MGRKYAIHGQQAIYFVTFTVVYWLDLFIRDEYRQVVLDSLTHCRENKGLKAHAYCIMTSHIHLILSAEDDLSGVIRDLKSFSSRTLKETIKAHPQESRREWLLWMMERAGKKNKHNRGFQLWQQHNHPIELSDGDMFAQRLDYLHNNPVVAGFVDDPTAWIWSSCASYEKGVKGLIEIDFLG